MQADEGGRDARDTRPLDTNTLPPTDSASVQSCDTTIATLITQFAHAGHSVHRGSTGDFTVSKWGMTRYCDDFAELRAFAKQLGIKP